MDKKFKRRISLKVPTKITEYINLATSLNDDFQPKDVYDCLRDHVVFIYGPHFHNLPKLDLIVSLNVIRNEVVEQRYLIVDEIEEQRKLTKLIDDVIFATKSEEFYQENYIRFLNSLGV